MDESTNETTTTSKPSGFNPVLVIVILAVLGIAGWMFYNRSKTSDESMEVTQNTPVASPTSGSAMENASGTATPAVTPEPEAVATVDKAGVKTFTLDGGSFYFKPNVIRIQKGDKVKVVLNSVDMMHNFVIDELKVNMPITKSGNTGTVEFTADQAGTFEFYCSVGQHRAKGMVGQLIVE